MTLKVGFAQVAAPTTAIDQDFTDAGAGFASDVKVAIFFGSAATANDTKTAHLRCCIGMAAKSSPTTYMAVSGYAQDAKVLGTTTTSAFGDDTVAFGYTTNTSSFGSGVATLTSWLITNGVRLNWSVGASAAYLVNCLMLGGDIEAKIASGQFANGTPSDLTLAHGLSGTPEVLLILTHCRNRTGGAMAVGLGFYDVATASFMGWQFHENTSSAPTSVFHSLDNAQINNVSLVRTYSVLSVDATNVVLRENTSNDNHLIGVLALRGTTAPLTAKVGSFTTATSLSSPNDITGMTVAPKCVIAMGTRITSAPPATQNSGTDCSAGFVGCAITNSGGIKQGAISLAADDAVAAAASTVDKSQTTQSQLIRLTTVVGDVDVEAATSAFNADGITNTYTNINASPFQTGYIAIGQATTAPKGGGMFGGMKELTGGMRG